MELFHWQTSRLIKELIGLNSPICLNSWLYRVYSSDKTKILENWIMHKIDKSHPISPHFIAMLTFLTSSLHWSAPLVMGQTAAPHTSLGLLWQSVSWLIFVFVCWLTEHTSWEMSLQTSFPVKLSVGQTVDVSMWQCGTSSSTVLWW
jgi:hypothetical protein